MPLMLATATTTPDRFPESDAARVVRLAQLVRQLAEVVAALSDRIDRMEERQS